MRTERFDVIEEHELAEEDFSPRQWAALQRLAAGDAPDANWCRCPACGTRQAIEFPDDRGDAPLLVCIASDAMCSEAEVEAALDEAALEEALEQEDQT